MARGKGVSTSHLTNKDRQRVYTLYYDANMTKAEIQCRTGYTEGQIRTAIRSGVKTRPRSGRPRLLNMAQEKQLETFVTASKANRFMTFLQLSMCLFGGVFGVYAIRSTLRRLGFSRRFARKKPPINEDIRDLRLEWAYLHRGWTFEQWEQILWTDGTWVTGGTHRQQYVALRIGEENHPDCIDEQPRKKKGWMFWGCFPGATGKGPGLFWEKEWGSIRAESYQQHILPLIDGWIRLCRIDNGEELTLMQDNAAAHAAASTEQEFEERGVRRITWPPNSPDLNPIEAV